MMVTGDLDFNGFHSALYNGRNYFSMLEFKYNDTHKKWPWRTVKPIACFAIKTDNWNGAKNKMASSECKSKIWAPFY